VQERLNNEASARWTQSYGYDAVGNRISLANTGSEASFLPTQTTPPISPASNRISAPGYSYDAAGNLRSEPTTPASGIAYDGEGRQTSYAKAGGATGIYSYDGDGRRVKKQVGTITTVFVYNAAGQMIAEYDSNSQAAPLGVTKYITVDHLGSTRVVTGQNQSVVARYDYLPFGEEVGAGICGRTGSIGYVTDTTRQKFTSKERDDESKLDYFLARYYSSAQGRFTSPDEFAGGPDAFWMFGSGDTEKQALPYADITDPQSLNKYAFCLNNPLRYVDPDGHQSSQNIVVPKEAIEKVNPPAQSFRHDGKIVTVNVPAALLRAFAQLASNQYKASFELALDDLDRRVNGDTDPQSVQLTRGSEGTRSSSAEVSSEVSGEVSLQPKVGGKVGGKVAEGKSALSRAIDTLTLGIDSGRNKISAVEKATAIAVNNLANRFANTSAKVIGDGGTTIRLSASMIRSMADHIVDLARGWGARDAIVSYHRH